MVETAQLRPPAGGLEPACTPLPLPSHLVALPGGDWCLWRSLVLRGAGFPARKVLALAAEEAAAAADRVFALEARQEEARDAALQALHAALDELRARGLWDDRDRRRPLFKALQALTGGKLPQSVETPDCAAPFAALAEAVAAVAVARRDYEEIYAREVARVSRRLAGLAREDRFREAVLWQNRHAAVTALGDLARPGAPAVRTSRRRQNEELAAGYLQRYTVKNDTIGFFGPVAYARLVDAGAPVSLSYGPGLLAHRSVYFEVWCVDALAQALGRDPALRPWLAPRLKSGCHLAGDVLHRPFGKPLSLSPAEARLLALCDGRTTAHAIAVRLADSTAPTAESEVYRLIEALGKSRALTWGLEVPLELHPDRTLAELLDRIEPAELRAAAAGALGELSRARRGVALAGDPDELAVALEELEHTFTRLTAAAPRRLAGQTYAARGLVYEDCRRDLTAELGPEVLARLGPALTLMLDAARWAAARLCQRLEEKLAILHAELSRLGGSSAVDSHAFFTAVVSSIFLARERHEVFSGVERELQERWSRWLGPLPEGERRVRLSAVELAGRFGAIFPERGPAWTLLRYLSPDVMIAAAGEEAFRRGEIELVLGELHAGNTLLWSCFVSQHPDRAALAAALAADTAEDAPVVLPQMPKQSWTQRMNLGLVLPDWYRFQFADEPLEGPDSRRLPAGEVVVEPEGGRLVARTRDGRLSFAAVDLFGSYLTQELSTILGAMLAPVPHQPRVSIEGVIVARERWRLTVADLAWTEIKEPGERFLALSRWARETGLPRFVFYKLSTEKKPCYLDLASPLSGDIFARLVRAARSAGGGAGVSISEMSPGLDDTWLGDAEGNLYTCELRLAALESPAAGRHPAGETAR